jgi:hypothetical protein
MKMVKLAMYSEMVEVENPNDIAILCGLEH